MSRIVSCFNSGLGWGRCTVNILPPILNRTREPEPCRTSTPNARSSDSNSDQRISAGVGRANTRSSVRRCRLFSVTGTAGQPPRYSSGCSVAFRRISSSVWSNAGSRSTGCTKGV